MVLDYLSDIEDIRQHLTTIGSIMQDLSNAKGGVFLGLVEEVSEDGETKINLTAKFIGDTLVMEAEKIQEACNHLEAYYREYSEALQAAEAIKKAPAQGRSI